MLFMTMKRSGAVGQADQKKVLYGIRLLILVLNIIYSLILYIVFLPGGTLIIWDRIFGMKIL